MDDSEEGILSQRGYFLEFDLFYDDVRNTKILDYLK
jgi:hypothetical protein